MLTNTTDSGTVVRWGSAYALARIIVLEHYRNSGLVQTVREIYEAEEESGVKNHILYSCDSSGDPAGIACSGRRYSLRKWTRLIKSRIASSFVAA